MSETITRKSLAGLDVVTASERNPYFNILFYGDSGTGKTTLAGSADAVPQMRPVIVLDFEGGTESLRHSHPGVDVVRATTWQEMQNIYNELYLGHTEYQTVVLDSLTEIQKFSMYDIMSDVVKKWPDRDIEVPSMREWGINLEQVRRMVRAFRDLEMHTIFTSLSKVDKDERTGVRTTLPSLTGKMAGEVAAFLDVVCYYYVKDVQNDDGAIEQKRMLLTQKTENIIAKDRSGRLPMVVEDPSMQSLYNIMLAKTQTQTKKAS